MGGKENCIWRSFRCLSEEDNAHGKLLFKKTQTFRRHRKGERNASQFSGTVYSQVSAQGGQPLSGSVCIGLRGLVWMNMPFSHWPVPSVWGCLLMGMQVAPVWVRVPCPGEYCWPKQFGRRAWWDEAQGLGVQRSDADFVLVCIKIKTTCFTWKAPFREKWIKESCLPWSLFESWPCHFNTDY